MQSHQALRSHHLLVCRRAVLSSRQPPHRLFTTANRHQLPSSPAPPFGSGPAPPRLPKEEQETFDRLQRSSTGAFSTPRPSVVVNQSPHQNTSEQDSTSSATKMTDAQTPAKSEKDGDRTVEAINARVQATGEGEELHPDVRRGAKPEFEGERNPKTGEVGGPKNEPLRWGGSGDWSYNGRVTDF
ncbi:MAG: acetylornithine aminotransferase [Chaenotheca gracillima]|nr:MAG: acetylornithine aminotransferase [Chaenotheca gracillima]